MDSKPLSYEEVCDYFNVTRCTIWRWTCSGDFPPPLPFSKKEKKWRKTDIENFIRYGSWAAVPKRKKMPR